MGTKAQAPAEAVEQPVRPQAAPTSLARALSFGGALCCAPGFPGTAGLVRRHSGQEEVPTEKKVETVQQLRERIERAAIIIAAEYRGLSVGELDDLRRVIRGAGVEMKVVKNRLFQRAAQEAQRPELAELLEGPTAVIFGNEDVAAAAKAVSDYMRQARNTFAVRKAVMDGQFLSAAEIQELASLPTRPVLLGQLAGALQAPITRLASLLNGSMQNLAGLLDARARQIEEA